MIASLAFPNEYRTPALAQNECQIKKLLFTRNGQKAYAHIDSCRSNAYIGWIYENVSRWPVFLFNRLTGQLANQPTDLFEKSFYV